MSYPGTHGDAMASPMAHAPHAHPLNQPHLMHDNPPPSQQPRGVGSGSGGGAAHSVHGTPIAGQGNENMMAAGNAGATPSADGGMKRGAGLGGGAGETPAQTQRVDGKDFFKQVRACLSVSHAISGLLECTQHAMQRQPGGHREPAWERSPVVCHELVGIVKAVVCDGVIGLLGD